MAKVELSDLMIEAIIEVRQNARRHKNFALSEALHDDLLKHGVLIEMGSNGVTWRRLQGGL